MAHNHEDVNSQNVYTVAAIIPCWNCEAFIGGMLDCLQRQTFSDWKAFFVDDGCTDGTADLIKKYTSKDARINYFLRNRSPKGAQTCRNLGFELSEGAEYVVFFDADDLIAPHCFEQRVRFIQSRPGLDFAVFPAKAFKQSIFDETNLVYGMRFIEDDLQAMLNWNLPLVVWNNIYRRRSLNCFGLHWDERLLSLQDSDFNIQAFVKGMRYEYADGEVDYFYRRANDGIATRIRTQQHYDSHICLLNKTLDSVSSFSPNYDFFLKNYVLLFVDLIKEHQSSIEQITRFPWICRHWFFRCKLMLFVFLKFRGKKWLFKKEVKYSRQLTSRWIDFMREKARSLRSNNSRGYFAN